MGLRDTFAGVFGRRDSRLERSGGTGGAVGAADPDDLAHLRRWASARSGVEVLLEPATLVDVPGVCLVAHDGQWTRRPVGDVGTARALARELGLPLGDATVDGYPERMREFERARQARARDQRRSARRETGAGGDETVAPGTPTD